MTGGSNMGKTMVEKILGAHAERDVVAGENVDIFIDARLARDFGGANVVENIRENGITSGEVGNKTMKKRLRISPSSEVQLEIYIRGGLLGGGC